jgi:hypothetical protein
MFPEGGFIMVRLILCAVLLFMFTIPAMAQMDSKKIELNHLQSAAKSLGNGSKVFENRNGVVFLSINLDRNGESTEHYARRTKAITQNLCANDSTFNFSVVAFDDILQEVCACDCTSSNRTVSCGYVAGGYSPF